MMAKTNPLPEATVDRMRELTSIGAGHAAKAFADLLGRPCQMGPPEVRAIDPERLRTPFVTDQGDEERRDMSGVFFSVEGGLGGVLALMIPSRTRNQLLERLVGKSVDQLGEETEESALREFGNILVSHVVSAMADTLGVSAFPSVPLFAPTDAPSVLASLMARRAAEGSCLRIETEISEREGELRGLLVFVPDRATLIAAPSRF